MINVTGLTKVYGTNKAIENLTFNAEKGEILGFLGPNGAGKTTTMRVLTGYLPPTSGKVMIGGFDIIEESINARRLIGYLPETVPLYSDVRVSEYLNFMADLHHVADADNKVDLILEKVGMQERSHSFIHKLSKGMRQRVGLAQALIHDPQVLILDEPTIGLDPAQIKEVRDIIKEIGQDHTVLLSTHILSEAQQICDRVLIINKGHIVAEDSPEHLQNRLSGARRVTISFPGNSQTAFDLLKLKFGSSHPAIIDENTLQFENHPDQDLRSEVIKLLVKNNIEFSEIFSESINLEEIFLQLTREESSILPQVSNVTTLPVKKE